MSAAPRRSRRRPRDRAPGPAATAAGAGPGGLLWGLNAVEAALLARRRVLRRLHLKAGAEAGQPAGKPARLRALAEALGLSVQARSGQELDTLTQGGHHQGAVLECGPLPVLDERSALALGAWRPNEPAGAAAAAGPGAPPLLVALDQVEDPRNLGAVVRCAAAFGAAGLVVPRDHSAPLSAVASSASAGALERFPVYAAANLARFLEQAKSHGFWAAGAVAAGGQPLGGYTHDRPLVLVLGNEGRGLRPLVARSCDLLLTIPMAGAQAAQQAQQAQQARDAQDAQETPGGAAGPESLNVSAAAAVLLYHLMTFR
jgi:23S rRNA (guanosine2251-2'-O)-methyltransferase